MRRIVWTTLFFTLLDAGGDTYALGRATDPELTQPPAILPAPAWHSSSVSGIASQAPLYPAFEPAIQPGQN